MSANQGYLGYIQIGSNKVANVKSVSFDISRMMEDITALSTSGSPTTAKAFLPTLLEGTCSLTCNYDLTDTNGQLAMQNALLNGTLLSVTLSPNNVNTYAFSAYVKKEGAKNDVSKVNEGSWELQPTGAFTTT